MDPLDLFDSWVWLTIIGGALVAGLVFLMRNTPGKGFQRVLCRLGALAVSALLIGGVILIVKAHNHIRNARELRNVKTIALVSLAADTELLVGGGEDVEEQERPKEAAALAYMQLKDTVDAFNKSALKVLPIENLKASDVYKGLSFESLGTRRAGLRHLNLISADSGLRVLPIDDPRVYQRIIAPLRVDGALVVQVRYQLDSDWRGSIPFMTLFTDPYWYGKVRINAWLFAKDGSLIWRYHEDVVSKSRERSHGFNYIIASGSSISGEQSINLLVDSISESAGRLSSVLEQDIKKATD